MSGRERGVPLLIPPRRQAWEDGSGSPCTPSTSIFHIHMRLLSDPVWQLVRVTSASHINQFTVTISSISHNDLPTGEVYLFFEEEPSNYGWDPTLLSYSDR